MLYTICESLRAIAVLHHAVMPKATTSLWEQLGADVALGPIGEQVVTDAGRWGQLPVGTTRHEGRDPLPAPRGDRRLTSEPAMASTDEPVRAARDARRSPGTRASSSARRCPSRCARPVVDTHCHLDIHDGDAGAEWLGVDDGARRARRRSA